MIDIQQVSSKVHKGKCFSQFKMKCCECKYCFKIVKATKGVESNDIEEEYINSCPKCFIKLTI